MIISNAGLTKNGMRNLYSYFKPTPVKVEKREYGYHILTETEEWVIPHANPMRLIKVWPANTRKGPPPLAVIIFALKLSVKRLTHRH